MELPLGVAVVVWVASAVGIGTVLSYRMLQDGPWLERLGLRAVLGMAAGPLVMIAAFELFGLRSRPWLFLVAGAFGLVLSLVERRRGQRSVASGRRLDSVVILVVALACGLTSWAGATRSALFEGRDPWGHALGVAYILDTGMLRQADPSWPVAHYVDGYPPLFDVLLAVPSGLAGSIAHPLMAATAVIVGLAVVALWSAARRLSGSDETAMVAALLYAALPSNLTRQVWSHGLAVVFFLAAAGCFAGLRRSRRWLWPGGCLVAGALLAAPTQGIKIAVLMAAGTAVASVADRTWARRGVAMLIAAGLFAAVWYVPLAARTGVAPSRLVDAMDHPQLRRSGMRWQPGGDPSAGLRAALRGSHHRVYDLDDFLFFRPHLVLEPWRGVKSINKIAPEGLGVPLTLLTAGFLLAWALGWPDRGAWRGWRALLGVWLALVVLGLLGPLLGVSFYVWRFWLLLCPLASLAAADALVVLRNRASASRAVTSFLVVVAAGTAAQLVLAVVTDVRSGAWRFLPASPWFVAVPLVALAWLASAAVRWRSAGGGAAVAVAAIAAAHVLVAAPARARVLTVPVEPLVFADRIELEGYAALRRLTEPGAKVLPLSGGDRAEIVVGLDRVARPWGAGEIALERSIMGAGCPPQAEEIANAARRLGYRFLVLDPSLRRHLDSACTDGDAFRTLALGLATTPGVALVASIPPAEVPSTSRWVLYRVDAAAGPPLP